MGKSGIVETIVKKQAESLEQKRNETNVVMGSKDGASAGNGHGSAMAPIRKRGKDEASAGHGAAAKPAAQGGGRRPGGNLRGSGGEREALELRGGCGGGTRAPAGQGASWWRRSPAS